MKPPIKKILVLVLVLLVILTLGIPLLLQQQKRVTPNSDTSRPFPNLSPKAQRSVDDSVFTKSGYIMPLESNATGSVYSPRAQVRATVKRWGTEMLTVATSAQDIIEAFVTPTPRDGARSFSFA